MFKQLPNWGQPINGRKTDNDYNSQTDACAAIILTSTRNDHRVLGHDLSVN